MKTLTPEQIATAAASLRTVGGVYAFVAAHVEAQTGAPQK